MKLNSPKDTMISFAEITQKDKDLKDSFHLLQLRTKNISHTSMPTFQEHKTFVLSHPYRYWCFVKLNKKNIGTLYLSNLNAIGINILDEYQEKIEETLIKVKETFKPLPAIKSVRGKYFVVNVAIDDHQLAETLKRFGGQEIQKTFVLT